MLIATSPRLSSDQEERVEREKSTEEAYPVEVDCMTSKCNSGIFCGKREDTQTYREHSTHISDSQSTSEYMTDWTTTKQPTELSQRTVNAQTLVYNDSVKPTIMQSDIKHHTKQPTESQGEDFIYYIQHAAAPSEGLDCSLQTAVQTDEFFNVLPSATVESEESTFKTLTVQSEALHCSLQMPTVQSEIGNPLQTLTAKSENLTNHLQISTGKSEKSCYTLKSATLESKDRFDFSHTANVQSVEPFESSHTATVLSEEPFNSPETAVVQSEEPFKSLKTAIIHSEELCSTLPVPDILSEKPIDCLQTETVHSELPCSSFWTATDQSLELSRPLQTSVVLSEKPFDCLQTETVHSEVPCNSFWTATYQPGELCRPLQTSAVQSERLGDLANTTSFQTLDLYISKEAHTVQLGDHYNLQQSALAAPNHPEVLYQCKQTTAVQAESQHATMTTEDRVDSTVDSGQRSSTQFADHHYVKQASIVQSEEIYLSRTCDSHWNDSITANKVAVEGDLNG